MAQESGNNGEMRATPLTHCTLGSACGPEPSPSLLWTGIGHAGRWVQVAVEALLQQTELEKAQLLLRVEHQSMRLEDVAARQLMMPVTAASSEARVAEVTT